MILFLWKALSIHLFTFCCLFRNVYITAEAGRFLDFLVILVKRFFLFCAFSDVSMVFFNTEALASLQQVSSKVYPNYGFMQQVYISILFCNILHTFMGEENKNYLNVYFYAIMELKLGLMDECSWSCSRKWATWWTEGIEPSRSSISRI